MPTICPYRLYFTGGLHLGTKGINLEETNLAIPSDTLYSAFLDSWRRLGENVEDFVNPFRELPLSPPFLLTSAFPFAGDVRFYPMPPRLTALLKPDTIAAMGKRARRIRYISEKLLVKVLSGQLLDDDLVFSDPLSDPKNGYALQNGSVWLSPEEYELLPESFKRPKGRRHAIFSLPIWTTRRVPRVTIDRFSYGTNLFFNGEISFSKDCGLWFGIEWKNKEGSHNKIDWELAIKRCLMILSEDGIGGERSVGKGSFRFSEDKPLEIPFHASKDKISYLLSRYHPTESEMESVFDKNRAPAYSLVSVSGWMRSPDSAAQRRKKLWMLDSGSLINLVNFPAGSVVDVSPEYLSPNGNVPHKIYRFGLALAFGWGSLNKEK